MQENIINSYIGRSGVQRTLSVEVEGNNVDIDIDLKKGEQVVSHSINLNRREALALIFHLVRILLPNKLFINRKEKKEKN